MTSVASTNTCGSRTGNPASVSACGRLENERGPADWPSLCIEFLLVLVLALIVVFLRVGFLDDRLGRHRLGRHRLGRGLVGVVLGLAVSRLGLVGRVVVLLGLGRLVGILMVAVVVAGLVAGAGRRRH